MTSETTFEVQSKRDGAWTIRESFHGDQMEHALSVAKDIFEEENKIEAVKVVKAVLDPEDGTSRDSVIYRNIREDVITKKTDGKGSTKTGASIKNSRRGGKKGKKTKSFGLGGFVFRLTGGVFVSFVIASLCALAATHFFSGATVFGIVFVGSAKTGLLIGVFVVAFLISMGAIAYLLIQNVKVKVAPIKPPSQNRTPVKPKVSLFVVAAYLAVRPFTLILEAMASMKRMKDAETAAASAAPAPPPTSEDKPNPADDTLSPTDEKLKERLNTFLNRALDGGQADKNLMDNFNRFGVSLFVAGASEILTSQGEIEPKSQIKILADCLLLLKFKKSHALSLSERYEEYLLADSRYMQMFQAGRGAISVFLDDATAAPRLLDEALSEWNKPKAVRQESGPVTVMFANMIRPPVRPGAEGEEKAERLIQLHSRIVGEALAAHSGMEVKRVTNGIMATFATAADAVVAGADMQKNATASKQSDPSLLLQMRIGINAGQPSPEEADLYGTVVRLSAQIGEKAPAERIYVSEQVSVFCDGMGFTFLDHGSVELPGSEEPVKIFEVHWRAINTETTPAAEPRVSENA